jgi:hypothetical protein
MVKFIPTRVAVLRFARAHAWVRESGANRGEAVKAILKVVGLPEGHAWCAAFVAYCGRGIIGTNWPLPRDARCQALYETALVLGLVSEEPESGSIFLQWSDELNRFRHTGFIIDNGLAGWRTIEGNTGGEEGDGVYERSRVFTPKDRFIVWYNSQ